jgi:hypothetical protein
MARRVGGHSDWTLRTRLNDHRRRLLTPSNRRDGCAATGGRRSTYFSMSPNSQAQACGRLRLEQLGGGQGITVVVLAARYQDGAVRQEGGSLRIAGHFRCARAQGSASRVIEHGRLGCYSDWLISDPWPQAAANEQHAAVGQ